ncbi:hypothetical protein A2690_02895 [Candidatus Roizmanbacteria bacterium RIFCSPHIGHO2_01_FULL_39_12b]|uniref:Nucleotidyl transferase AbiEii/AbiGii toxin family protein n=1 Tax=Candidatus Roizmanbacteria bacterium RIFCSPHIGHO2_01_FULL_39_12b TaxID=1802030 RepID=A0A1F7G7Y4_9BACT|nr:MAG: hypothetical protein A2690_02895 [Candidatus Roizmanbacteria bacterium RIFCSPHIGHO2_01_FULL_39_12b]OGK45929.1 MAG: hypothetical protein A3B46_02710 [Candidatus Roizmanbacteria bacterium RIFCSPLOWO2_01_FULL_39_19]
MLPPYLGQLNDARQQVFKKLASFSKDYVLAGGTAIMLQIGHRESYDFDCFSAKPFSENFTRKVIKIFNGAIKTNETDEVITFLTKDDVEMTFVTYPYKILRQVIKTNSLPLFHLDDLAANKAYTIGRRGQWRDYIDIFFLLKQNLYDIQSLISLTNQKYQGEFNEKLFLGQLAYFDDVKIVPVKFLKDNYSDNEVKTYLQKEVEKYTRSILE